MCPGDAGRGGQCLQRVRTERRKPQGECRGAREGDRALAQPLPPGWLGSARLWALATRVLALTGGFPPACVDHSSRCRVGPDLLNLGSRTLLPLAFPDFPSLIPLLWASASCSVKEGGSITLLRKCILWVV